MRYLRHPDDQDRNAAFEPELDTHWTPHSDEFRFAIVGDRDGEWIAYGDGLFAEVYRHE